MSRIENIALSKLSAWAGNVRRTGPTVALDELAASIAAHGFLNPLTVRSSAKDRFELVAGQRRLLALRSMMKAGVWPKGQPMPCSVIESSKAAAEVSLAENVVRLAMHPAD